MMSLYIYMMLFLMSVRVAADDCPIDMCGCFQGVIGCDGLALTTVPSWKPVYGRGPLLLNLNRNEITAINAGDLPPDLYALDCQINPITTIAMTAFDQSLNTMSQLLFAGALFTQIPEAVLRLNSLTQLTIKDTYIHNWNRANLTHISSTLEDLTLDNVGITFWLDWIQDISHLETLQLSGCSVVVPDNAFDNHIHTLSFLNLENCTLDNIPNAISKLTGLKRLVLDNNNISRVTGIPQSVNLSMLSLNNNKLSDADELSNALRGVSTSLQELQLNGNKFTTFPDLSFLVNLESLYVTDNNIYTTYLGQIPTSLSFLDLENNMLPSLYSFIQAGHNLEIIKFKHNSIRVIQGVDIPARVVDMDISKNIVTELTNTCFPVNSSMETLTLDLNPISKIYPLAFSNLKQLMFLSLQGTRLTRLPLELSTLTGLYTLDLRSNTNLVCTCMEKSLRPWSLSSSLHISGDCGQTSIDNFLVSLSSDCPE